MAKLLSTDKIMAALAEYEDDVLAAAGRLTFKGKTLEAANKEQVTWLAYYDERRVELKTFVKRLNMHVEQERGKLFQLYTENYSRVLSDRAKDKYIDRDPEYIAAQEKLIEVEEMYEKFAAVVEAFKARGFALRNLVEIKVNQIEDSTL